jgi:hypothetical protein
MFKIERLLVNDNSHFGIMNIDEILDLNSYIRIDKKYCIMHVIYLYQQRSFLQQSAYLIEDHACIYMSKPEHRHRKKSLDRHFKKRII